MQRSCYAITGSDAGLMRRPLWKFGVVWKFFMSQMMDSLKRILFPTFFFLVAAWLVWCGNVYNDKNYSLIPAFMCAAESILLIITGAAIIRRQAESEER